ncbi:MAG: Fe-Mn family superoxide dismutase [Sumerlaeia bacterium]
MSDAKTTPDASRRDFLRHGGLALAGTAFAGIAMAQQERSNIAVGHGASAASGAATGAAAHKHLMQKMVPGATDDQGHYVLPPLPYGYDALEPHIDAQTMRLHHDKHHQGYVDGLIKAEEKLQEAMNTGDYSLVEYWTNEASFNGAGHFLHCIFWDSMGPNGGGGPSGALSEAMRRDFGSEMNGLKLFAHASASVEGSGWGILGYQIAANKLVVLQARNHQLLSQWAIIPLLCVDVWEHAYYLKYQNKRKDYIDAFMNVVNWDSVGQRYNLLMGKEGAAQGM